MNKITGRWKLGILLALSTAFMWGVLPVSLQFVLLTLDAETTTFFRFLLATLLLTGYLIYSGKLTRERQELQDRLLTPKLGVRMLVAGLLLVINYGLYIFALEKSTAEGVQVMMQIAPILLLLCGIKLFNEKFSSAQWLGFLIFVVGLGLFFNQHLIDLFVSLTDYGVGLLLAIASAVIWTGYAIIQKFLLEDFTSEETMLVFYWMGTLAFLPFCDFSTLPQLSTMGWVMLIFSGLNTLIAYGCFAEALAHAEASRVSATLATTPIITVVIVQIIPIPGVIVEPITWLTTIGTALVVFGSIITATASKAK